MSTSDGSGASASTMKGTTAAAGPTQIVTRVRVGRADDNDIVLEDPRVSRRHAELTPLDGRWIVRDLNSGNGTLLNGSPISTATASVGDRVQIGETTILLTHNAAEVLQTAAVGHAQPTKAAHHAPARQGAAPAPYRAGDTANAHVLDSDNRWHPLEPNSTTTMTRSLPGGPPAQPPTVGMSILLTVITLGIWQLVWLHGAMHSYRRLSGRKGMDLDTLYWTHVGALIASVVLSMVIFPLGLLGLVAAVAAGAVLLNEMLEDRDTAAAHAGIPAILHSRATLLGLYIGSNVLGLTLIGIIVAIPMSLVYLAMLFGDHNRLTQPQTS